LLVEFELVELDHVLAAALQLLEVLQEIGVLDYLLIGEGDLEPADAVLVVEVISDRELPRLLLQLDALDVLDHINTE
jgi:hypothetical protein